MTDTTEADAYAAAAVRWSGGAAAMLGTVVDLDAADIDRMVDVVTAAIIDRAAPGTSTVDALSRATVDLAFAHAVALDWITRLTGLPAEQAIEAMAAAAGGQVH